VAPFGLPVRSRGAYHFVAPMQRDSTPSALVLAWLQAQAAQFRLQRDALLRALPGARAG
jgi:hypothetical protein